MSTKTMSDEEKRRALRRRRTEQGSVLVEMALVVLPLMLIAMGMVEYGLTWRDKDNLENASRAGARTAANLANNPESDRQALLALVATLNPDQADQVDYVIIYELDAAGNPPAGCLGSGATPPAPSAGCNVYPQAALVALNNPAMWSCSGFWDTNWCPTTRDPQFATPIDLGVHIQAQRAWITGMFPGDGISYDANSIFRLNPLNR